MKRLILVVGVLFVFLFTSSIPSEARKKKHPVFEDHPSEKHPVFGYDKKKSSSKKLKKSIRKLKKKINKLEHKIEHDDDDDDDD